MPNIKSAIKRVDINQKKNAENKTIKSKIATYIKKFKSAVKANELETSEKLLPETVSLLDSAARENIIHKNSANSKKASLSKLLDNAKKA